MEYFPGLFLPASRDRWCDRLVAGVRAFESTLGISLSHAHSGTKARATVKDVPDLREFFEGRLLTKNRWFSLFSGNGLRRTEKGFENVDHYGFGGKLYGDESLFSILITTPPLSPDTAEKLLVSLGDAMEIHAAQYTPDAAARRIRLAHWCIRFGDRVIRHPLIERTAAEEKLPVICESTYEGLAPKQPHHFGWLNYWSAQTCANVDFVAGGNREWLTDTYLTPRGGRILKLGARPPEAEDEIFASRLRAAYEDFPKVARRL